MRIALVGNPNTGKSSLFNALTGLKQKVGNFPGITVEKSTGYFSLDGRNTAEITDLPGTYSLFPKSLDEAIPYEILLNKKHPQHPDLVLFIADASNLKRNLVLLTQLIDLKIPVILALNMVDQATAKGIVIDQACLAQHLDIPIVPINARKQQGIPELVQAIREGAGMSAKSFQNPERPTLPFDELTETLEASTPYHAELKLHHSVAYPPKKGQNTGVLDKFREENAFDSGLYQREDLLYRYRQVNGILKHCLKEEETSRFDRKQEKIDNLLTHKVWGYVIFFGILFTIFQAIFNWAEYPMHLIEAGFSWLSSHIAEALPEGVLNDLITNGVLAGLSGVLVFIPQIAFLFLFITIMEDTGYLARVAFLMDRTMRKFGLNGKSVIPLISGTACAVPAIMASRNIEHKKSRLITILVTPLMSCSARLPVYILLIGLVVPDKNIAGILNLQGIALMGLYVLGFLAVIGGAYLFKKVLRSNAKQYFILELPVYRMPNWKSVAITVYKKVRTFVTEAGKIIVAISIVLWFLASYGPPGAFSRIDKKYEALEKTVTNAADRDQLNRDMRTEKLASSYAGMLGKGIEPVIAPLGYDWKIGIALVTSFAAREVFVGTMATLYGLEGDESHFSQLKENMRKARDPVTHEKTYTFATVVSLLIFYVFAMQCMSTLAVTYKETASLKWTLVQLGFMTSLAYLASLIVFQLLR